MSTRDELIAADLRRIRSSWGQMLTLTPRAAGTAARVAGSREPQPPVSIAVLSVRREVCEVLASWCLLVLDDQRDINGDAMVADLDGTDAPGMAGWLLTWADFLGAHPAADLAVAELAAVSRACHAIATETRVRRFTVGPCTEVAPGPLGQALPCPGHLVAVLRSDEDLLPGSLTCSAHGEHTWDATQWRRLGDRIHSLVVLA